MTCRYPWTQLNDNTEVFGDGSLFTQIVCSEGPNGHTSSCNSSHLMRLSLVRGAGARSSAARHCGGAQSTAAPPFSPLLPRARAGAQHDAVPLYGALGLSDTVHDERRRAFMWGARSSNGPPGLSLDGTDAGTFDSADSGLGHSPHSKKCSVELVHLT